MSGKTKERVIEMAKRKMEVVFVNREGVTCVGIGPHRGKPVYRVPQDYVDWCLENLPYANMLRQVMESEDIRRRVDGLEPKPVNAKNRLAGDIDTNVRPRRRRRSKPRAVRSKLVDTVPKGNHDEAQESLTRKMPEVGQVSEGCPF